MGTLIKKRQIENLGIVNADIASGAAIATSKLADGGNFIKKDGSVAFTADQSMGTHKITDLAAPVNPNDAARLIDVQNAASGISPLAPVRAATTANITLSGTQTIDGVAVVAADRVLVKNQTTAAENGIYDVSAGAWTRSSDADNSGEITQGSYVLVNEGTTLINSGWIQTAANPIAIGTDAQTWVQFSAAQNIVAGGGLTKTGNTINVGTASSSRIVINSDDIDLATVGAGGTGTKITFDAYGRVTGSASATAADVGAQAADATLTSLVNATTGIMVKSASGTITPRTIAGTTNRIAVTNGSGVAGNPTIDLADIHSGQADGTIYNGYEVDNAGRVIGYYEIPYLQAGNRVTRETPTGTINSSNTNFTLANIPVAGTEEIFRNGVLQDEGAGNDYTISGPTISFAVAPDPGEKIRANYFKP
jgi:hypothetical protein